MELQTTSLEPRTTQVHFTGNGREYFGIWIVNLLLSVLTLGIYSAWAKVRTLQYFYGHSRVDGQGFRYLATPLQILKGRRRRTTRIGGGPPYHLLRLSL